MDATDFDIIKCLRENSRMNASVIGERIGMSVSAVIERIKRLESHGVIRQYTLSLDPKRIGMDVLAFVSVSLEHPKFNDKFIKSVLANHNVVECHYITGDFDFLLKVMTESMEGLANALSTVKSIAGVSLTRTIIVLSSPKNDVCALPDAIEAR